MNNTKKETGLHWSSTQATACGEDLLQAHEIPEAPLQ